MPLIVCGKYQVPSIGRKERGGGRKGLRRGRKGELRREEEKREAGRVRGGHRH